jgi:hypothetical protein
MNGASNTITSITGTAISQNILTEIHESNSATISLGTAPIHGSYELIISNGSENTVVQIVVEDTQVQDSIV